MKSREFREIQVSSTQLAIIFLGILVIGVVIFLLGVSVGKKHAQAALKANVIAQQAPEQVKEKIVSLPQVKPEQEDAGAVEKKAAATQVESSPAKTSFIPKKTAEKPKVGLQPAESKAQAPVSQYYVQVGALADRGAAQETAQKFRNRGYPVVLLDPQPTDKKPVYRVRIGGFSTREQAEQAREKLSSEASGKTDYFIVRD